MWNIIISIMHFIVVHTYKLISSLVVLSTLKEIYCLKNYLLYKSTPVNYSMNFEQNQQMLVFLTKQGAMRQSDRQGRCLHFGRYNLILCLAPPPSLMILTLTGDMAAMEELSPSAGPVSIRPPEDEIDDDEDEDVSGLSFLNTSETQMKQIGSFTCLS